MSNQDEDEVEDELDALEKEISRIKLPDAPDETVLSQPLPDAPTTNIDPEVERLQKQKERARARKVALEAS